MGSRSGAAPEIELFDTAEGAVAIEILDPDLNPVSFEWEIACQNGEYRSDVGTCSTSEQAPAYGYGPGTVSSLPVWGNVGTAYRSWGSRSQQNGLYSDRLIRLRFDLPTLGDNPTWYDNHTWFRIRYTVCDPASFPAPPPAPATQPGSCSVGDRTTWSVQILGDPVRLVE